MKLEMLRVLSDDEIKQIQKGLGDGASGKVSASTLVEYREGIDNLRKQRMDEFQKRYE